ncbi:MAG: hypothetical protein ACFFFG_12575 [Candidatus Thorarchaeota archaeon]
MTKQRHLIRFQDSPPNQGVEGKLRTILECGHRMQTRDDFIASLSVSPSKFPSDTPLTEELILLAQLTGLLKRKYYQTSVLGQYLLAYDLNCVSYIQIFYDDPTLTPLLERPPTHQISDSTLKQVLVAVSEWYRQSSSTPNSHLEVFLEAICHGFDSADTKDALINEVRPIIDQSRKEEYIRRHLGRPLRQRPREDRLIQVPSFKSFRIPEPRSIRRGEVLAKVLSDLYFWLVPLETLDRQAGSFERPYFDILEAASQSSLRVPGDPNQGSIQVSQYTRTVTWIMKCRFTTREQKFLDDTDILRSLPKVQWSARKTIKFLQANLRVDFIQKYRGRKKRRVLSIKLTCHNYYSRFARQAQLLRQTCSSCQYWSTYTKCDCLLFKKLEYLQKFGYTTIPDHIESLFTERVKPIFARKPACPFWSPQASHPVFLVLPQVPTPVCIRCHSPLPNLPTKGRPVVCRCSSQYSFLTGLLAQIGVYGFHLANTAALLHDLGWIGIETTQDLHFKPEFSLPLGQVYDPTIDPPSWILKRTPGVVVISEKADVWYEKGSLVVDQKPYKGRDVTLIDTEQWNGWLEDLAASYPNVKFNYRQFDITISPRDKAHIQTYGRCLVLSVKRPRKKNPETYPLHQLQSVYNVGKPRLSKSLERWGIRVVNISTKGISSSPMNEIKAAVDQRGVRQVLTTLHIQGLLISQMNAVWYLAGLAIRFGVEQLGRRYLRWMNRLLPLCPSKLATLEDRLTIELVKPLKNQSFRFVSQFEAWFSRPFAEGIRRMTHQVRGSTSSLIQRPYGRLVARLVKKQEKRGLDFMGAYTAYDAALTSLHRSMRYRLRIWNAKQGLGFYTIPLFVHTTPDNPGRAGHLDLEEVGRILSRLVLCKAVAQGNIQPYEFQVRYDDNYLPYYVPSENLLRRLRRDLLKKELFPWKLWYNHQWMPFSEAHKYHVNHLCSCLVQSLDYSDAMDRTKFLRKTYNPLIYRPDFSNLENTL